MASLRLGLVQMNSLEGDVAGNLKTASDLMDEASERDVDLFVLPEFFNTEYFYQYRDYAYLDYAEGESGPTVSLLKQKAREHRSFVCAAILEEDGPGVYYDTAFMISREGVIVGKYRKTHPAAVRSLEKIYFRGGTRFPVFAVEDWKVGVIICYDHFFPETARIAMLNGAELLLGPFAAPHEDVWESLMRTRAFENGMYLAPCNKVGKEGDWTFGGMSMVVDPFGRVLERGSGSANDVVIADVDRAQMLEARRRYPMLRDRRPEIYGALANNDEVVRGLL